MQADPDFGFGATNDSQAFVHDLTDGSTVLVSTGPLGAVNEGISDFALSGDGKRAAFSTFASNFAGAQLGRLEVFMRDLGGDHSHVFAARRCDDWRAAGQLGAEPESRRLVRGVPVDVRRPGRRRLWARLFPRVPARHLGGVPAGDGATPTAASSAAGSARDPGARWAAGGIGPTDGARPVPGGEGSRIGEAAGQARDGVPLRSVRACRRCDHNRAEGSLQDEALPRGVSPRR